MVSDTYNSSFTDENISQCFNFDVIPIPLQQQFMIIYNQLTIAQKHELEIMYEWLDDFICNGYITPTNKIYMVLNYDQLSPKFNQIYHDRLYCDICGHSFKPKQLSIKTIETINDLDLRFVNYHPNIRWNFRHDTFLPYGIYFICPTCKRTRIPLCMYCKEYIYQDKSKKNISQTYEKRMCLDCQQKLVPCEVCHTLYFPSHLIHNTCDFCYEDFKLKQITGIIFELIQTYSNSEIINKSIPRIYQKSIKYIINTVDTSDSKRVFIQNVQKVLESRGVQLKFYYNSTHKIDHILLTIFSINRIIDKIQQNTELEPYELCPLLLKYGTLYSDLIYKTYPDHVPSQQLKKYLTIIQIPIENSDFSIIW